MIRNFNFINNKKRLIWNDLSNNSVLFYKLDVWYLLVIVSFILYVSFRNMSRYEWFHPFAL